MLSQEQGKPLARAIGEIFGCVVWFRYTASLEIPVEVLQDDAREAHRGAPQAARRGGAITPWNFPVILAVVEARAGAARAATRWC